MSEGLIRKYNITRVDGDPVREGNVYWVLKLYDAGFIGANVLDSRDVAHVNASRVAWKTYADNIKETLPKLAEEIYAKLEQFKKVDEIQGKIGLLQGHLTKEQAKLAI